MCVCFFNPVGVPRAWFFQRFSSCLLMSECLIGGFLCIILGSVPYNAKVQTPEACLLLYK